MYEYDALVDIVHDGDTVHVQLDLGINIWAKVWVRLDGINSPELGMTKALIPEGEESTLALMEMLGGRALFSEERTPSTFGIPGNYTVVGPLIPVRINTKMGKETEKYGRLLGRIYLRQGETLAEISLNDQMVTSGHAAIKTYL